MVDVAIEPQDKGVVAIAAEDNTLVCLITGASKKVTEKEQTLQAIARSLTSEYGFDVAEIARDFRLVFEDPETGRTKRVTTSLVVFEEGSEHIQENIIRICIIQGSKTKSTDQKNGVRMLEDAMGAVLGEQTSEDSGCEFGLWTNGSELYFYQKRYEEYEPEPIFQELADFPGKGESLDDLDRPDRQMLRVAAGESLLNTLQRCHDYIYGNQGRIKTAFWELLNVIFCKIYDERLRELSLAKRETYRRRFWVGVKERNTPTGRKDAADRIHALFDEVKTSEDYQDVFTGNEEITLNDIVLSYIAGEIGRYSFLDASVDVKGMAYESIVSNTLKQERGQFFTPRNIIRLMVEMMDPGEEHSILDPACGSGGFLVMVLDHVRQKISQELYPDEEGVLLLDRANSDPAVLERARTYAEEKVFGSDFDIDLRKAARMNMMMSGDGHGNIYSFNSLQFPHGGDEDVALATKKGMRCSPEGGSFDFVFTNPPFGAKIPIDDPEILRHFELGYRWHRDDDRWVSSGDLQKSQPPEILFIERCYQFLKPGGKMAIVLPDGILGNPDLEYVRYWILQNTRVLASIDLPLEAFLPQVGVQASLLFLQRKTEQEKLALEQLEYDVFMAITEKVGKDRRGNPIYVRDDDGSELIFKKEIQELRKLPDGTTEVKALEVSEREIDDDLPKTLEKWQAFLNGEVL